MGDLANFRGCPAPRPVTLTGRFVTVEPYDTVRHLHDLWNALGGMDINPLLHYFAKDDFTGMGDLENWLDTMRAGAAGWVTHVFRDNATAGIAGMSTYLRADPANGVVEIGGVAHGPAMARSPLSTEAHYLMARHVFDDLGYRRYEWKCNNDNDASKAAALRLGFRFEGLFRQHMVSKGKSRDTAWFSMIDGEWPNRRHAFEAWLSADNFDAKGGQIRRLEAIREEITQGVAA